MRSIAKELCQSTKSRAKISTNTAIILSLLGSSTNLFRPSSGEEWVEHYYGKLPKQTKVLDIPESDLPYLKALIKMKCRDFDLSLKDSYRKSVELQSDLFSEKRLLESLYANKE